MSQRAPDARRTRRASTQADVRVITVYVGMGQVIETEGVVMCNYSYKWLKHESERKTGWWFGTFFIFPKIWNNHPN